MSERRKRCSKCGEMKPLSAFYVRNRKTTKGIKRGRKELCKKCDNAARRRLLGIQRRGRPYSPRRVGMTEEEIRAVRRDRYRTNTEMRERQLARKRERHRERMEELRADPEALEAFLARRRALDKAYRERRKQRQSEAAEDTVRQFRPRGPRLPVEPFREWLAKRENAYPNRGAFAEHIGLDERRVHAHIKGETRWVPEPIVDLAVTRDGSTSLRELYPERYDGMPDSSGTSRIVSSTQVHAA